MIVTFRRRNIFTKSKNTIIKINWIRKKFIKNKWNHELENKQTSKRFENEIKKNVFDIW